MANVRDLRQRIRSVGNIQKITRAMEMVATTKLRRFQGKAVSAKPYTHELEQLVRRLGGAVASRPEGAGAAARLFEAGREGAAVGVLFVGSDRGLCGAYNSNVQRCLDAEVRQWGRPARMFVVGRKAMRHCARRGYEVAAYLEDRPLERLSFDDAAAISALLVRQFVAEELSAVYLCYTSFVSMMRFEPRCSRFLPITPPELTGPAEDLILEPSGPEVLARLIPSYLETAVYHALLESITSEYASRRFAMKNATEAAGEMKHLITRQYNKVRQAKITSEILEVVAGAEAL
ncbi:MAG: ATP synthase F1 subunit gamma [Planctomycetota bacterium]|nr:MAG: ATP synthase F1 subunit gamma [Planctomycetota bacterium]